MGGVELFSWLTPNLRIHLPLRQRQDGCFQGMLWRLEHHALELSLLSFEGGGGRKREKTSEAQAASRRVALDSALFSFGIQKRVTVSVKDTHACGTVPQVVHVCLPQCPLRLRCIMPEQLVYICIEGNLASRRLQIPDTL